MHLKDWCWRWSSNTLATWCEEMTHWKISWYWQRLMAGREGGDWGWDGWMASLTQWTWVWGSSQRQWRAGVDRHVTVYEVTISGTHEHSFFFFFEYFGLHYTSKADNSCYIKNKTFFLFGRERNRVRGEKESVLNFYFS